MFVEVEFVVVGVYIVFVEVELVVVEVEFVVVGVYIVFVELEFVVVGM